MERHLKDYTLWILCVDDETHDVLIKLNLSNVRLIQLSTHETPELLKVKSMRSKGEYCWTLTPYAPRFVFDSDENVNRVTYIDADLWFRKSPDVIFKEFESSKKHVFITEHGYSPNNDLSATSGIYCVQFMIFNRSTSESVRSWWEERCIEWCYARFEDNKFGDQKYLDDWKVRFPKHVHAAKNLELFGAPWNSSRFPYSTSIVYHFHSLRIMKNKRLSLGFYTIPSVVRDNVYKPYIKDIAIAVKMLRRIGFDIKPQSDANLFYTYVKYKLRIIFDILKNISFRFFSKY